ncbi:Rrf2 family transcriptional regulator [Adlercreutzia sp. R25]|uniref:Rrf2 family transcriptional regulator n=1 Tax=Adlercreutzia shanghongiae TaxID=3111773 RepID=UPI002DB92DB7|nr:Rrf2 family transcriptional regulator [Adlercreutzia sp. R25]MEC4272940.1 Rrf2 family transcriptional regulator [Adlercreutzia sp. R25]
MSATTEYALRFLLYLAASGGTAKSYDISREMGIPRDFLIVIAQPLRAAGVVESVAGRNGGYRLARDPGEVSFAEVRELVSKGRGGHARAVEPAAGAAALASRAVASFSAAAASFERGATLASMLSDATEHRGAAAAEPPSRRKGGL